MWVLQTQEKRPTSLQVGLFAKLGLVFNGRAVTSFLPAGDDRGDLGSMVSVATGIERWTISRNLSLIRIRVGILVFVHNAQAVK